MSNQVVCSPGDSALNYGTYLQGDSALNYDTYLQGTVNNKIPTITRDPWQPALIHFDH